MHRLLCVRTCTQSFCVRSQGLRYIFRVYCFARFVSANLKGRNVYSSVALACRATMIVRLMYHFCSCCHASSFARRDCLLAPLQPPGRTYISRFGSVFVGRRGLREKGGSGVSDSQVEHGARLPPQEAPVVFRGEGARGVKRAVRRL